MARFSLGRDEDGEGQGSDDVPHSRKRPRVVSVPPQPQQPPQQPPRLLIRPEPPVAHEGESEDSEEDDESSSDSEQGQESEEEEVNDDGGEEEEEVQSSDDDDDEVAILATRSARPSGAAQATPPQVGSSSTGDRAPEALRTIPPVKDGPLVFSLADPDVLDCLICYEPLTVPVFQCENGHIACCSCCIKSKNKCPSCTWPIGYNRCRAIEKVLESIRVACQNAKHGCRDLVAYSKKNEHEKTCIHSPCLCPHLGCRFVSSCKQLYLHFSSSHVNSAIRFVYNKTFSITLKIEEKFLVLRDQTDGVLFILANERKILGNCVSLQCIQPTFLGDFFYDILAKTKGSSQRFQSSAKNTTGRIDNPSTGYFIIPSYFFSSSQLKIDLCIWRGLCPAPLQFTNVA